MARIRASTVAYLVEEQDTLPISSTDQIGGVRSIQPSLYPERRPPPVRGRRHRLGYPRRMRWLVAITALACFAANDLSNRRAPGFSLPDSSFKRYDLQDYRGKWLLIDFMVTNCPHCRVLSRTLEEVKRKYPGRVNILSVVVSPPETQETVKQYIEEEKITSPIVFDQGQMAASYFEATPAKPSFDTPHLFVINPSGMIVRDYGHSSETHDILEGTGLMKELDALFKGKP